MLQKLGAPGLKSAAWTALIAYVVVNITKGEINVPFYGRVYKFGGGQ